MAILQYFGSNEFFITAKKNEFRDGQFCWIVVPHIEPIPKILDVQRSESTEHNAVRFQLRQANQRGDFRTHDRSLPIKNLRLRSNEELLTQRAKKRPGVIISTKVDQFPEIAEILVKMHKEHLQEEISFVLPCYGIQNDDDPKGFPREMVSRIRCLIYRQFFYFPPNRVLDEGIIRLDRIQVVVGKDPSTIQCEELCLSEKVFPLLQSLFCFCITGIQDDNLAALRALTIEAFQP